MTTAGEKPTASGSSVTPADDRWFIVLEGGEPPGTQNRLLRQCQVLAQRDRNDLGAGSFFDVHRPGQRSRYPDTA